MIQLRPYQADFIERCVDLWPREKRILGQMPTGAGKTKTTVWLVNKAIRQWKQTVMVLLHTRELRRQWLAEFEALGLDAGVIAAGCAPRPYQALQVAQVQSLARRFHTPFWSEKCDLLVIDEAHHAAAATYMKCIYNLAPAAMLGLSATPARLDGKGLNPPFSGIVCGPTASELIEYGALADYQIRGVDLVDLAGVRKRMGDYAKAELEARTRGKAAAFLETWQREAPSHQTMAFCLTRKQGRGLHRKFLGAGIPAGYADGTTPARTRDNTIEDFRAKRTQVLVSVDLLGEGIDIPGATCALLCRATSSITRHLQAIGRVLRPHDHPSGKSIIVDCVGNCSRLGGPRTPRHWTLDGIKVRKKKRPERTETVGNGSKPAYAEVEVRMVTINDFEHKIRRTPTGWLKRDVGFAKSRCETFDDFKQLGKQLGYKRGWAYFHHRLYERKQGNAGPLL